MIDVAFVEWRYARSVFPAGFAHLFTHVDRITDILEMRMLCVRRKQFEDSVDLRQRIAPPVEVAGIERHAEPVRAHAFEHVQQKRQVVALPAVVLDAHRHGGASGAAQCLAEAIRKQGYPLLERQVALAHHRRIDSNRAHLHRLGKLEGAGHPGHAVLAVAATEIASGQKGAGAHSQPGNFLGIFFGIAGGFETERAAVAQGIYFKVAAQGKFDGIDGQVSHAFHGTREFAVE
ncbi:MAG: hypothetical protein RBU21_06750 [FCB group bacterium]|nr:hypothetical protein [FCB group bacterium]